MVVKTAGSILLVVLTLWLIVIANGSAEKVKKKKKGGHIAKAIFSGALAVFAALVTTGWFMAMAKGTLGSYVNLSNNNVEIREMPSYWQDASSPDGAVKTSVPRDWKPSHTIPNAALEYANQTGGMMVSIIPLFKKEDFKYGLDALFEKQLKGYPKLDPNLTVTPLEKDGGGYYPDRLCRLEGELQGIPTVMLTAIVETRDQYYVICEAVKKEEEDKSTLSRFNIFRADFQAKEGPPAEAGASGKDRESH